MAGASGDGSQLVRLRTNCLRRDTVDVNFTMLLTELMGQLNSRSRNNSRWNTTWGYIQNLQMFTPMPLDLLGKLAEIATLSVRPGSRSQESRLRQKTWPNIYRKVLHARSTAEIDVNCTTDPLRFPPVLCQAACLSTCPDCVPNRHRCRRVTFLQMTCRNGEPTWLLESRHMRMIAPDSCECMERPDEGLIDHCALALQSVSQ